MSQGSDLAPEWSPNDFDDINELTIAPTSSSHTYLSKNTAPRASVASDRIDTEAASPASGRGKSTEPITSESADDRYPTKLENLLPNLAKEAKAASIRRLLLFHKNDIMIFQHYENNIKYLCRQHMKLDDHTFAVEEGEQLFAVSLGPRLSTLVDCKIYVFLSEQSGKKIGVPEFTQINAPFRVDFPEMKASKVGQITPNSQFILFNAAVSGKDAASGAPVASMASLRIRPTARSTMQLWFKKRKNTCAFVGCSCGQKKQLAEGVAASGQGAVASSSLPTAATKKIRSRDEISDSDSSDEADRSLSETKRRKIN